MQDGKQETWLQLMRDTFETQVIAWRRSNCRAKQLCILQERWKIESARVIFQRQADVEQALRSGNAASLRGVYIRLLNLDVDIKARTTTIKGQCDRTLAEFAEVRAQLRSAKKEYDADAGTLRDQNLLLLYSLMVEAIRLAWLQKEHLQVVELCGLIHWAASDAGIRLPSSD